MKPREPHPEDWKPNPGPQTRLLSLTCHEALFGGQAGGGKTDAALVDSIRYIGRGHGRDYQGLILRRTFPELEKFIIARSQVLYPHLGGVYNEQKNRWQFPGGERVYFGYLDRDASVQQYQGSPWMCVWFDELTQFTRHQYTYLMSRLRSAAGIQVRIRGATNPGGNGHEWVFDRWCYWLDPKRKRAEAGEVLYLVQDYKDVERVVPKGAVPEERDSASGPEWWHHDVDGAVFRVGTVRIVRDGAVVEVPKPALGRTFVPSKLTDNPYLATDPTYAASMDAMDPVLRAQLRDGDWLAKPGAGLYLKRSWFSADSYLDAPPPAHMIVGRCRAWDLAASVTGDWTVGTLELKLRDGTFVVADVRRMRGTPNEVDAEIEATAALDGILVTQRLPQDPGQAGVHQKSSLQKKLARYRTVFERPTGDKVTRFGPFSSACQAGNVKIVRGEWNAAWFAELEGFPEGAYDDQADSAADAHNFLTGHNVVRRTGTDSAPTGRRMDGW